MYADHPNRKPTRLRMFDYSEKRTYFVTICTHERRETLADICRGGALLRPIGQIAKEEIEALPQRFLVSVDKYVIMPNHIHMLLTLNGEEQSPSPTLSDVVCAFKSIAAKRANQIADNRYERIWQRSFHDHIVRGKEDYLKIWQYIDENPIRWEQDCFYGKAGMDFPMD